jgi:hypothetical protein
MGVPWTEVEYSLDTDNNNPIANADVTPITCLNPGETAHFQVDYTSGTARLRYEVFTTTKSTAVNLANVPAIQGRVNALGHPPVVVKGYRAFVVQITNDEDATQILATVRIATDGVDLTA